MNKILTSLVVGFFAVSLFAAESDGNKPVAVNTGKPVAIDTVKQKAFEQWQKSLPDSIKAKIEEHQKNMTTFKTEMEQQRIEWKAKIDSEKVAWQSSLKEFFKTVPDSFKNYMDSVQVPDSIKAKFDQYKALKQAHIDTLKALIQDRRDQAKLDVKTALAKLDADKKAKYEKALAQIDKKLADRQQKAEEAQKKLDAKKAAILEKIAKESKTQK